MCPMERSDVTVGQENTIVNSGAQEDKRASRNFEKMGSFDRKIKNENSHKNPDVCGDVPSYQHQTVASLIKRNSHHIEAKDNLLPIDEFHSRTKKNKNTASRKTKRHSKSSLPQDLHPGERLNVKSMPCLKIRTPERKVDMRISPVSVEMVATDEDEEISTPLLMACLPRLTSPIELQECGCNLDGVNFAKQFRENVFEKPEKEEALNQLENKIMCTEPAPSSASNISDDTTFQPELNCNVHLQQENERHEDMDLASVLASDLAIHGWHKPDTLDSLGCTQEKDSEKGLTSMTASKFENHKKFNYSQAELEKENLLLAPTTPAIAEVPNLANVRLNTRSTSGTMKDGSSLANKSFFGYVASSVGAFMEIAKAPMHMSQYEWSDMFNSFDNMDIQLVLDQMAASLSEIPMESGLDSISME